MVLLSLAACTQKAETSAAGIVNDPALGQVATRIRKAIESGDAKALLAEVSPDGIACMDSPVSMAALAVDLQEPGYFWALLYDTKALRNSVQSVDPVYSMREFFSHDAGSKLKAELQYPPSEEYVWMCWHSKVVGVSANPPCFTMRKLGTGRWVIVRIGASC
jgi:hypothetical protein